MAFLHSPAAYLPERIVTNEYLAERVGKTAEWIAQGSGIRERRWAEGSVADLGVVAAQACLSKTGLKPVDIGMLIVSSGSSEHRFPGPASTVAQRLGLPRVPALDIPIASAGSLFAIVLADNLAAAYGNILVVAAEKMSSTIDLGDPNTAILFGDGAGACLISPSPGPLRIVDSVLHSDGAAADILQLPHDGPLRMEGLLVARHATREIPASIQEVLARQLKLPAEIGLYVLHQANLNLIVRVARALNLGEDKFFVNLDRYGNTSSASLLVALAEAPLPPGPVILAAFGAGLHWGAAYLLHAGRNGFTAITPA